VIVKLSSAIVGEVIVVVVADGPTVLIFQTRRVIFPQMNGIAFVIAPITSG
jgi:hypothetical protein